MDFLLQETMGYKIITIGSSAGAYAAVLYGSLLNAYQVIAFNPLFEIKSKLISTDESINPLVFRLKDTPLSDYYDIIHLMETHPVDIFYFYSNKSERDKKQCEHARNITGIHRITFSSAHHGIPFLKVCLPRVINLDKDTLLGLVGKVQYPYFFSVKMVGLWNTLHGLISQIYKVYVRKMIRQRK